MTEDILSEDLLEYARGTLSPDMREKVEQACKADPKLAEELAYYQGLRAAVRDEPYSAKEEGWEKLSLAIDNLDTPTELPTPANDRGRLWRWAACALGVALIGQTALIAVNGSGPKSDDAIYATVTAEGSDTQLQVSFKPLATEGEIRGLLLEVEAEIVEGPSAIGLYVLSFESESEKDLGLKELSENQNIIDSVAEN